MKGLSLVTDLTEDEVQALQEEMQHPANVDRLTRKFTRAASPCISIEGSSCCPLHASRKVDPHEIEVPSDGLHPTRRERFEVTHWNAECFSTPGVFEVEVDEGGLVGPVFNRDLNRYTEAKQGQPDPGARPILMSDSDRILRMEDGSLVHQTKGCLGTTARRLP